MNVNTIKEIEKFFKLCEVLDYKGVKLFSNFDGTSTGKSIFYVDLNLFDQAISRDIQIQVIDNESNKNLEKLQEAITKQSLKLIEESKRIESESLIPLHIKELITYVPLDPTNKTNIYGLSELDEDLRTFNLLLTSEDRIEEIYPVLSDLTGLAIDSLLLTTSTSLIPSKESRQLKKQSEKSRRNNVKNLRIKQPNKESEDFELLTDIFKEANNHIMTVVHPSKIIDIAKQKERNIESYFSFINDYYSNLLFEHDTLNLFYKGITSKDIIQSLTITLEKLNEYFLENMMVFKKTKIKIAVPKDLNIEETMNLIYNVISEFYQNCNFIPTIRKNIPKEYCYKPQANIK